VRWEEQGGERKPVYTLKRSEDRVERIPIRMDLTTERKTNPRGDEENQSNASEFPLLLGQRLGNWTDREEILEEEGPKENFIELSGKFRSHAGTWETGCIEKKNIGDMTKSGGPDYPAKQRGPGAAKLTVASLSVIKAKGEKLHYSPQ